MNKTQTKTDQERRAFLASIDVNPDGSALSTASTTVRLAADGVDPHTMPVTDIEFDSALLDGFPDLTGQGQRAAADHVFALYKSPGRNKDRNSLLWSHVGKFIVRVRRERGAGVPHVKEQVRATGKQRDLLALLSELGVTSVEDLTNLLPTQG